MAKGDLKMCSICRKLLPTSKFYKDGSSKSKPRLRPECKACYNKRRKERDEAKSLKEVTEHTPVRHIGKEDL